VAHYLVLNHLAGAEDPQPTSAADGQQAADVPPAPSTPPRDGAPGTCPAAGYSASCLNAPSSSCRCLLAFVPDSVSVVLMPPSCYCAEDNGAIVVASSSEQAPVAPAQAPLRTRQSRIDEAMPQRKAAAARNKRTHKLAAPAIKVAMPALTAKGVGTAVLAGAPAPETPPATRRRSGRLAV
jgi:hypothetical protein